MSAPLVPESRKAEEPVVGRLLSVNVGLPREIPWRGQKVRTAIWKDPVQGKRMVRRLNIDGDRQGDLEGHGGEHRAVLVYQMESFRYWEKQLHRTNFTFGQFGENFTVEGLPDREVCIGDQYRVGGALFEVTQPRVTCYRLGIRMGEPRLPALLVTHGRPGFYLRVLQEGEVEAGNDIFKVRAGPEGMSVAEIDRLLYMPGRPREDLERAIRIPALSSGWKSSFQALIEKPLVPVGGTSSSNPALPPGGSSFRHLRVSQVRRETGSVFSLDLAPIDSQPLAVALPGQFVVVRLRPDPGKPSVLRSYSLSGPPGSQRYRLGIKKEIHGVASNYLSMEARVGDVLEVSAPRGNFLLRPGDGPIVLISAGIGVTPLLAMLHALAAEPSPRLVWWLHGARSGAEHAFAAEARELIRALPRSHRYVQYSQPRPEDQLGRDFDSAGRLDVTLLARLGVPLDSDFYICGPPAFLRDFRAGLGSWGVAPERVLTEIFGPGESYAPGQVQVPHPSPHVPAGWSGSGPRVSFARSGLEVRWDPALKSLLELAEACNVPVQWSCRTGVCHNCETTLIEGDINYEPQPLEPPSPGSLLICCASPCGDAILDL